MFIKYLGRENESTVWQIIKEVILLEEVCLNRDRISTLRAVLNTNGERGKN